MTLNKHKLISYSGNDELFPQKIGSIGLISFDRSAKKIIVYLLVFFYLVKFQFLFKFNLNFINLNNQN